MIKGKNLIGGNFITKNWENSFQTYGVVSLFDTEFVLKGIFPKELSKDFHRAFELRQISDYKVTETLSLEKAEEIFNKAYQFVEAIRKYLLTEG